MSLLSVIIAICVVGVVLWVINSYVPMEPSIKKILNIAVILILVVWLLQVSGLLGTLGGIRTG